MTCEVLDIHPPGASFGDALPTQVHRPTCACATFSVSNTLSDFKFSLCVCVCYVCVYVCAYTCVCVYTRRGQRPAQDVFLVILIFKTRSFAKLGVF